MTPDQLEALTRPPPNPTLTQLARITRLLEAARLEVQHLKSTDRVLRLAICTDLDALLANLRATSVQVARRKLPRDLRERR